MADNTPVDPREGAVDAAMRAGDIETAIAMLAAIVGQPTATFDQWLKFAALHRRAGNLAAALAAVDSALALKPLDFTALLLRGALLDRLRDKSADAAYGHALAQRPAVVDPALLATLDRAIQRHSANVMAQAAVIADAITTIQATNTPAAAHRLQRFVDNSLRRTKAYAQQPTHFHYPGLPAREFHDSEDFPWLPALEAATDAIEAEMRPLLAGDAELAPYIDYDERLPLAQWAELNRSKRWSALHLIQNGVPVDSAAAACPATMALLAALPQPQLAGRSPAAMFSVLAPRTRIPPHTGVANVRLVVHLPLIVPPGCGFRVGAETREWVRGKAWVFDDTIEHEAWNDSDLPRVILIFDIWAPALSAAERVGIVAVMAALPGAGDL